MACEKYSGWLIEAALDALSPQRQAELAAHTAECRACREAYDRLRAASAFVERGVGLLVSTEPSPHFATKLRARLAAERPPHGSWHFGWAPVGALAAVLVAVAAFLAITTFRTPRNASEPTVANVDSPTVEPVRSDADVRPSARSDSGEIATQPTRTPTTETRSVPELSHDRSSAPSMQAAQGGRAGAAPAREQQPEVLVQPGQFAMIERFAEAAREGHVDTAQTVKLGDDDPAPLDVEDIEIAPLKIKTLPRPDEAASSDYADSADSGKS
jgi:hypothetical protein